MPLDFPLSPALNQVYSLGGKSWKWNGDAWETYNDNLGVDFVETVNGTTGDITVAGGTDISVSTAGKTVTVNYTGSSSSNAVTSFNGNTGAVQGVSSVNGLTGTVQVRAGQGITYSITSNGISFAVNYTNPGQTFELRGATAMNPPDLMLFQVKQSGGIAQTMYLASQQSFYDRWILPVYQAIPPKASTDPLSPGSGNSFLMTSGGGVEGYVSFTDQVSIIQNAITLIDGGTFF